MVKVSVSSQKETSFCDLILWFMVKVLSTENFERATLTKIVGTVYEIDVFWMKNVYSHKCMYLTAYFPLPPIQCCYKALKILCTRYNDHLVVHQHYWGLYLHAMQM